MLSPAWLVIVMGWSETTTATTAIIIDDEDDYNDDDEDDDDDDEDDDGVVRVDCQNDVKFVSQSAFRKVIFDNFGV